MKYIVTEDNDGVKEIFVFPRNINHDCMAEALSGIRTAMCPGWERIRRKPVSAGFVAQGICFGESISLRLKSADGDTALLGNAMR